LAQVVKYTGRSDVRVITKEEWQSIDISDQDTVKWDWKNDWEVPVGDLSQGALNYAKNKDPELSIMDSDQESAQPQAAESEDTSD
jgi:predicted sulfurtransferase